MSFAKIKIISCLILALLAVGMSGQNTHVIDSTLVSVAHRQVSADDLLGGVSYFNVTEVMDKNDMTASGISLPAYLPGMNGNIWGSGSLTLIDGVPRDMGNIVASEIQQITVLKGIAAVALYGSHAAKGVTLVTTKRGVAHKNEFKIRANTGINVPKFYPEYLGSAEYMTLYNEARRNDRLGNLYDAETIYNHASGINPYRYPNVDYYSSEYLRDYSSRSDVTGEFSGGNDRTRYYINVGYYHTNTLLNVGSGKDESYSRFYVRGNLDMNINKFISAKVNTSIVNYNTNLTTGDYWGNAATLRPNWYTPLIPVSYLDPNDIASQQMLKDNPFVIDGKYLLGGTQQQLTNPFAVMYTQGNTKYTARQYQIDATLNFDLNSVLPGLGFYTQLGVDYYGRYYLNENSNDYAVYAPVWNNAQGYDMISSLVKYNENKVKRERSLDESYGYQKLMFTGAFTYGRTFDDVHNVSGLLLASAYQQTLSAVEGASSADISEAYHKPSNANLGLQIGYNYKHKYYADFTGALVHSAKLAPGRRNALSPTISAGWRISSEKFMSGLTFIDNLKLTASAGIVNTDMDISSYYMYKPVYTVGGSYEASEGRSASGTDITRPASDNIDFIKRKEINLGLEAVLFNKLLNVNLSWFKTRMNGMLVRDANAYPGYFVYGNTNLLPWENYDENLFKGFDAALTVNKKIGEWELQLGAVGTYSVGEAVRRSENYTYSYQSRIGQPLSALWGLKSDGLFMNQKEIDESPNQTFGSVVAGDIKYIDQNNDGRIDSEDEVYLGRQSAPFIYALNFTAKWKGFTFFMLWQGQTGGNAIKSNDYYRPGLERKYSEVARERTTLKADENGNWMVDQLGTFPRLSTNNTGNNFRNSDYWMYNTDYLKLAQVQLSYNLPKHIFNRTFLKEVGVYVKGGDLLTISKSRKILETNPGSTPSTRFFNVGATITF